MHYNIRRGDNACRMTHNLFIALGGVLSETEVVLKNQPCGEGVDGGFALLAAYVVVT